VAPLVLVVLTFRGAVADWNDVPTGSMIPTIIEGDRIFVNKLAYGLRVPLTYTWVGRWDEPERGEIVVLHSPEDGERLVKRVIGVPGDLIAMQSNRLYINGEPLSYGRPTARMGELPSGSQRLRQISATEQLGDHAHAVLATPAVRAVRSFGPIRVPGGQYFVMGDNRDLSADSRVFGFVPRDQIVGRCSRVVISFDRDNWYLPRLSRFWQELP
jgi:signal peptidase I